MPKHQQVEHLLQERQVQGQRPIDYFGRVQVPMPIGRFHRLEQQVQQAQEPEGECSCVISFSINHQYLDMKIVSRCVTEFFSSQ